MARLPSRLRRPLKAELAKATASEQARKREVSRVVADNLFKRKELVRDATISTAMYSVPVFGEEGRIGFKRQRSFEERIVLGNGHGKALAPSATAKRRDWYMDGATQGKDWSTYPGEFMGGSGDSAPKRGTIVKGNLKGPSKAPRWGLPPEPEVALIRVGTTPEHTIKVREKDIYGKLTSSFKLIKRKARPKYAKLGQSAAIIPKDGDK